MPTNSSLIPFRTISQITKVYVLPEVESRISSGIINSSQLPLNIKQFRLIQTSSEFIVELNDEVKIEANIKVKRAINAGELITLADIYPEECYIVPPTASGKPAPYFLFQSMFLTFFATFDFSPNLSDVSKKDLTVIKQKYPLVDFLNAKHLRDTIDPIELFKLLASSNWPPTSGYYPNVLIWTHTNPDKIKDASFLEVVAGAYNHEYWNHQLRFWTEAQLFSRQMPYIQKSVSEYFEGDFVSAIYVLVPHFEGIVKDYIRECGTTPNYRFKSCVKQLREIVLSRKILMFPPDILKLIFEYIEKGSFFTETSNVTDASEEVNRHGIAHGVFTGFETKKISLKYLILVDSLALVLLHDKILRGVL